MEAATSQAGAVRAEAAGAVAVAVLAGVATALAGTVGAEAEAVGAGTAAAAAASMVTSIAAMTTAANTHIKVAIATPKTASKRRRKPWTSEATRAATRAGDETTAPPVMRASAEATVEVGKWR